jgi:hypothetical protein
VKLNLIDRLAILVSALTMVIEHGVVGRWSVHLAAGVALGCLTVGSIGRAVLRSIDRDERAGFLESQRRAGTFMTITNEEKELITAMREREQIEARK